MQSKLTIAAVTLVAAAVLLFLITPDNRWILMMVFFFLTLAAILSIVVGYYVKPGEEVAQGEQPEQVRKEAEQRGINIPPEAVDRIRMYKGVQGLTFKIRREDDEDDTEPREASVISKLAFSWQTREGLRELQGFDPQGNHFSYTVYGWIESDKDR